MQYGQVTLGQEVGHVTKVYQHGPADAGHPNPSALYVNAGMYPDPSLGHLGSPPTPLTIFKEEEGESSSSVPFRGWRSTLPAKSQPRTNTSRERTPSGDNTLLDQPYVPWTSPYAPSPYSCVGHYSPPSHSAVFFCRSDCLYDKTPPSSSSWPT